MKINALGDATAKPHQPTHVAAAPYVPVDLKQFNDQTRGNFLPVRIGASSEGGNGFVGDIHRARIHTRALEPSQVGRLAAGDGLRLQRIAVEVRELSITVER